MYRKEKRREETGSGKEQETFVGTKRRVKGNPCRDGDWWMQKLGTD
jgi:hypothetical protein